jgi:hypothetical protein
MESRKPGREASGLRPLQRRFRANKKRTVKYRTSFAQSQSGAKAAAVQTLRAIGRCRRNAILKTHPDFHEFTKTVFIRANS